MEDIQAKLSSLRLAMDNVGEAVSSFIKQQRKGQLISKCPFGVFKSLKKKFLRIFAQASKEDKLKKGILLLPLDYFILTLLHYFFFDLLLEARAEIFKVVEKI